MAEQAEEIVYFEEGGPSNTEVTLALVAAAADRLGIRKVVLASTGGDTAAAAMDRFAGHGLRLIIVPHQFGFGGQNSFRTDLVDRARAEGHQVYFGTMLFHLDKVFGSGTPMWVANFLRAFGDGTKVCFEILLMATNAGLVSEKEPVIVVAGTGRGADTALVMQGATTMDLKSLWVSRVLCKPLLGRAYQR